MPAVVFAGWTIDIPDLRRDYGEPRINTVSYLAGRMVIVCLTPRGSEDTSISMRNQMSGKRVSTVTWRVDAYVRTQGLDEIPELTTEDFGADTDTRRRDQFSDRYADPIDQAASRAATTGTKVRARGVYTALSDSFFLQSRPSAPSYALRRYVSDHRQGISLSGVCDNCLTRHTDRACNPIGSLCSRCGFRARGRA